MPLEIKELHIKVSVGENSEGGASSSPAAESDSSGTDGIIRACVEEVLKILKDKQER